MLEFINSFIRIAKKAELLHPFGGNAIWLAYELKFTHPPLGLKPETSNDSAETYMNVTFCHNFHTVSSEKKLAKEYYE
jgi:hypothetical protein